MKKIITLSLFVFGLALTGCTTESTDFADLQTQVTTLEASLTIATTSLTSLEGNLENAEDDIADLESELETSNTIVSSLQEALINASELANAKLLNAFGRDTWLIRKVAYDASWIPSDAEYCFGVFNEDWSTIDANDYTHNGGLKFVITIEEVKWGTEYLAKDSCGNYSELLYQDSPYGLYSMPAGLFEVGKTYSVVLYKDTYFTVPQLGLLPVADMGDFGAYPEDLSGITSELIE
jgi:hypothetical protein